MAKSKGNSRLVIRQKAADCVGCAFCAEVIPQYFKLDDDGMAVLINAEQHGVIHQAEGLAVDLEDIKEAAKGCATNIISVNKT